MSEPPRQSVLRFSLGGTASQAILGLLMAAAGFWIASQYAFHLDEVSVAPGRRGYFLQSNGGLPGVIIGAVCGLCFVFWTLRAGWRFFSDGKAAVLTDRGIMFHRSSAKVEIPYGEIAEVNLRPLLGFTNMYVRVQGRRRIRLQSNEVEGGKEALLAFAEELNARRAFGGEIASR